MGEDNQSTAPGLNHRRPVDPFLETLEKLVKKPLDTLQTALADILSDAANREKRYLRKTSDLNRQVAEPRESVSSLQDHLADVCDGQSSFSCLGERPTVKTTLAVRTLRKIEKNQENKKAWPKEAGSLQGTTATAPQICINYAHQSLLGDTPTTEEVSHAGDVRGPDKAKTARKSPPPGPTQSLLKFDAEKDEPWKLVTAHSPRAKRRALYVGNLGVSTPDSSLAEFVISRAAKAATSVQVHSVKIFSQAPGRPTLFARILVDADISALVLSREVWPWPFYCWKWHYVAPFKDKNQEALSKGKDQEEAGTHSIAGFSHPPPPSRVTTTDLLSSCPPSRTGANSTSLRTCWPPCA